MANNDNAFNLLRSKLYRPRVTEDYVPRPRLENRLDRILSRPLTLVSAPAGYGKTTLISAWAEHSGQASAWLALDETDNDLSLFTTYLVAAVRELYPAFGETIAELLKRSAAAPVRMIIDTLVNEFSLLSQECIVVLENYHLITNLDIHALLTGVLHHPHHALHLVLLTRFDPPLPLVDLRARNQVVDIRITDLRFAVDEVALFAQKAFDSTLGPEIIALLREKTEGWPAGMRLIAISAAHLEGDPKALLDQKGSNPYIMEYLASQVMLRLPANTQRFLIQSSILDQMSADLCKAVIASGNSTLNEQVILEEIERDNLFTNSLDNRREWFRFHSLFRHFLQVRLLEEYSSEDIAALHSRAGLWFAQNGYIEVALHHFLAAGETNSAIQIVATHRHEMMNQERWRGLLRWLSLFSQTEIAESPDLLLTQAWFAYMERNDQAEMALLVDKVEAILDQTDPESATTQSLWGEVDAMRCVIFMHAIKLKESISHGQRALALIPQKGYVARSYAWIHTAGAQKMNGDSIGAHGSLRMGMQEDFAVEKGPRARNYIGQAFLQWIDGDLESVENTARHALGMKTITDLRQTRGWAHYFMASVLYHRNDLTKAEEHARSVFDQRFVNPALSNIYSAFMLALIDQIEGRPDKAQEHVSLVTDFLIETRSIQSMIIVDAFQAELALMQGKIGEAMQWLERTGVEFSPAPWVFFYIPQLAAPKVLLAQGTPAAREKAAKYLGRFHEFADSLHNSRVVMEVEALQALIDDARGDRPAALDRLAQSLTLAEAGGFIRLYVDLGPRMAELLKHLLGHGTLVNYVAQILNAFPDEKQSRKKAAARGATAEPLIEHLTDREFDVLRLLAGRFTNKEIAVKLVVSSVTVKRHTINIYQKLGVNSRQEAVVKAERLGIL